MFSDDELLVYSAVSVLVKRRKCGIKLHLFVKQSLSKQAITLIFNSKKLSLFVLLYLVDDDEMCKLKRWWYVFKPPFVRCELILACRQFGVSCQNYAFSSFHHFNFYIRSHRFHIHTHGQIDVNTPM